MYSIETDYKGDEQITGLTTMHDRLIDCLIAQAKRNSNPYVKLFVIIADHAPIWNIRTENDMLKHSFIQEIDRDNLRPSITAAVNYCWNEYTKANPS